MFSEARRFCDDDKCHRRDMSVLTLTVITFLPCVVAVATISLWPLFSSLTLQPPFRDHLQVLHHRTAADSSRFLSPGAASFRGRRPYQEDRILCSPGIHVPHASARSVGLFGVFDGHFGDAASDFAASSIVERFLHHSSFGMASLNMSFTSLQRLESDLLAAISDIDSAFGKSAAVHGYKSGSTACVALKVDGNIIVANLGDSRAFFCSSCEKQYFRKRFKDFHDPFSNHRALRPNQGHRHQIARRLEDTALHPHSEGFCVKSLTSDHRPDRLDEKLRIKAFGGFVTEGSIPRVNGQLAVSRSIGDIDFRKYGVISEPEVSGWHQVSEDDKFLIIASDGIFEKFSPEEVCNVLHALRSGKDIAWIMNLLETNGDNVIALPGIDFRPDASAQVSKESSSQNTHEHGSAEPLISSHFDIERGKDDLQMTSMPFLHGTSSYAQILSRLSLEIAFRAGSMDNLSIVIVPLML